MMDIPQKHLCPHCQSRFSLWAKGVFGAGSALRRVCHVCRREYWIIADGQGAVKNLLTLPDKWVDVQPMDIKCLYDRSRHGESHDCGTLFAAGVLGAGTDLQMKCRRCHKVTHLMK